MAICIGSNLQIKKSANKMVPHAMITFKSENNAGAFSCQRRGLIEVGDDFQEQFPQW